MLKITNEYEVRDRVAGIRAFDGREGLDFEMTTVTGEPDPKRQFVRCVDPIHFGGAFCHSTALTSPATAIQSFGYLEFCFGVTSDMQRERLL